ncbi:MAG TPA: sigma-54-dependent Fis family transcriptional regulator [Nitrospirae bacterium]|nr:sigma-54-dependent Fis family transcriptional regulator [Nitrospirota bacterium]
MSRILIVDDDSQMREALTVAIHRYGYPVDAAKNANTALEMIKEKDYSLIITDMKMPGMSGLEFIKSVRAHTLTVPILVITGFATVENAVECMKHGASDYLMKPFSFDTLEQAIRGLLNNDFSGDAEIITGDERMLQTLRMAKEVARTDTTVLITGESGTGKELVARYIHKNSNRSSRRMIAVNCAAIPDNLLESELFGHEKGAFTGAIERKIGKFELANKSTLLLDEIGEMPTSVQAKLLRVLQEKEIDRIGGRSPVAVDIRIIATTNRDLIQEIEKGNFREDLYYRLGVFPIELPPLRERPGDIVLLANHFLERYTKQYGKTIKGFSPSAVDYMNSCPWRGNIRELQNAIQRAVLLCTSSLIEREHIIVNNNHRAEPQRSVMTLKEMEREMIIKTLKITGGNRTKAAEKLGITVRTLRNKLNEYQLNL